MRSLLTFILTCLFSVTAFGIPITCMLFWDAPTELDDQWNTPLDQNLIIGYRVFHAIDADLDPNGSFTTVDNNLTEELTIDIDEPPGDHVLKFGVVAVLNDGRTSVMSMVLEENFTILSNANPKPPTNLRIQIDCIGSGCIVELH